MTPSTPSRPHCKITTLASKTTMLNESTDLANCSHSKSSHSAIRQQQILTDEEKIERKRQQLCETSRRARERKNKAVKHHQLCYHHHLHQRVPILRLEENNKKLQHRRGKDRGRKKKVMAIFFHITEFYINNTIKLYIIKHHTIVMLNNFNHN